MGTKIVEKKFLNCTGTLFEMVVEAPQIAKKAKGGNFVILRLSETGERFPLTIADYDREKGTITMVVLAIGKSTKLLSEMNVGDEILDFVGPLGLNAHTEKVNKPVVVVGGGVGIAAIYPQAKELKQNGNYVISILGARTKELLFWQDKFKLISDELIITTDDGSEGRKGLVTDALREIITSKEIEKVIAIGPLIMMKFVAELTRGDKGLPKVPTVVSLNPIMVDGTGMCGGCRFLTLTGETKFACVDGPDVDGHNIDFNNLLMRNKRYLKEEKSSMEELHACKIGLDKPSSKN
jgi:ferredoxin--NADP+ reductase